jgi:hypothetical protein
LIDKIIFRRENIMKKEFAVINHGIEDAPYHNWDVILETQDTKEILDWIMNAKEDGTDTSEYTIEEYTVTDDGEFYEGSDFDTLENFENRYGTWYAVLKEDGDDWGTGSHNLTEAKKMVAEYKANGYDTAYIAVIDDRTYNPVCIDEIR